MRTTSSFVFFILLSPLPVLAQTQPIAEQRFVSIGGIEQWITIEGEDITKPVILFLHGGPGSVMTPYTHGIYGEWKEEFVLVNWDQRGAGRTYGRNVPSEVDENYWVENPLTVERMVKDGIELAEYLITQLQKEKIILLGTSWGSVLATKMALLRPDLFHAYIGHAQIVNFSKSLAGAYHEVYRLAVAADDKEAVEQLQLLGPPPYDHAMHSGRLLRIVKEYEEANSVPAPLSWWQPAPNYNNDQDAGYRVAGDDYSFIHLVGHQTLGIKSMVSDLDFYRDGFSFEIPVYLIQGEMDILTSKEMTAPYFEKIEAPRKEYFLLPNAGHGLNQSVVDKQYQVLKNKIRDEIISTP